MLLPLSHWAHGKGAEASLHIAAQARGLAHMIPAVFLSVTVCYYLSICMYTFFDKYCPISPEEFFQVLLAGYETIVSFPNPLFLLRRSGHETSPLQQKQHYDIEQPGMCWYLVSACAASKAAYCLLMDANEIKIQNHTLAGCNDCTEASCMHLVGCSNQQGAPQSSR